MSTLETHDTEQAAITEACEAGRCDHPECRIDPMTRATEIMDEARTTNGDQQNHHRAARALVAFYPSYDDAEVKTGLLDFVADLLHLCDLAGYDFAKVEKAARVHYQRELMAHGAAHDTTLSKAIERN